MSDSISVRVTLDSYDMASTGRQTQVYVQIPGVARVAFLLPAERYHGLVDRAWPEVLDVTNEYVTYGEAASNAASTAAWMAVQGWLQDPANRDEMQAAFEEDRALRNPSQEVARLRARLAEHEVSPLGWARLLDAKSLDNFMCALGMAADTDPADGALAQVEEMIRSFRAALPAGAEQEPTRTLHDHIIARDAEIERLRARLAEVEAAPTTVYRAQHDSIVMGLYSTRQAAYEHCEAHELRDDPVSPMAWNVDEDGVAELVRLRIPRSPGAESATGYVVTPLEIASEYDEGADE